MGMDLSGQLPDHKAWTRLQPSQLQTRTAPSTIEIL